MEGINCITRKQFYKKVVLNFALFTGKHLCWNHSFNRVVGSELKTAILESREKRVLSYVPYDHRRLLFLTSDSESLCSNSEEKSTMPLSFVIKNLPLWIKYAD